MAFTDEGAAVTMNPTDTLAQKLGRLSLLFLGQHLWSLKLQFPLANMRCCLCRCCAEAREAYKLVTGQYPSTELEEEAMRKWGNGE